MVKIEIITMKIPFLFHFAGHAAAIVTNLETGDCCLISHSGFNKSLEDYPFSLRLGLDSHVALYSNKNYEAFKLEFNSRFCKANFKFFTNNCSKAVDFTLHYFFPEAKAEERVYTLYKILLSLPCILSLGIISIFPTPPGLHSPSDTHKKALLLKNLHGSPEKANKNTLDQLCAAIRHQVKPS